MATLQSVRSVSPVALPLPIDHAPRVMTPELLASLSVLNSTIRALREMGLHVVWTKHSGIVPQAHIQRDADTSIAMLLDRMGPRSYRRLNGCTIASGLFQNVLVSWVEPINS